MSETGATGMTDTKRRVLLLAGAALGAALVVLSLIHI